MSASGYRQYEKSVVSRLKFIRYAKDLGFTLAEIIELLERWLERWLDGDVRSEPVASRPSTNKGFRGTQLLVRPQQRVYADRPDADLALDASAG